MKRLLLMLALIGSASTSQAQLLNVGDTAVDFTLTDINGQSHNLYSYLDSGYTVLIDISATWCPPCWSAHQSEFMKHLEEEYGVNGTVNPKKIKVIFIEGDGQTTTDELHGMGSSTQGDWVTGEPYIFIDNTAVNSYYLHGGYPTFTLICPSKVLSYVQAGYGGYMGDINFWVPKIDSCNIGLGINEIISDGNIGLYPNPATNQVTVKLDLNQAAAITFIVSNILGQQVIVPFVKQLNSGNNSITINTDHLSAGLYFMNIHTEKGDLTQKFIKK